MLRFGDIAQGQFEQQLGIKLLLLQELLKNAKQKMEKKQVR
jgi:hypothetical protein